MKRPVAVAAGCLLALTGCSAGGSKFQWREVSIAGTVQCLPVAYTTGAQRQGLQGVRQVVRPMVFAFSPPSTPSFWMKDTPAPLTGVWVGSSNHVIGYWRGEPNSTDVHDPPARVSAVIEYALGAPVPAVGATFAIGRRCEVADRRL